MAIWVALLRGINVGGHHSLPMAELRSLVEDCGGSAVRTYIQSGNLVFCHRARNGRRLADRIAAAIEKQFAFRPWVLAMPLAALEKAYDGCPFPDRDTKRVHFTFLATTPEPDRLGHLMELRSPTESLAVGEGVLYLHAPEGIRNSKLAAAVDTTFGVPATARNGRTVGKILDLARLD